VVLSIRQELLDAGIPIADYINTMNLVDVNKIKGDKPYDKFKNAILYLNKQKQLPSWLSKWCKEFGVEYIEPQVDLPKPNIRF
jgi:hypothetical protein